MGMLHQFGEVNTFFSNVLIPLALFALYCGSFAYLSLRLLPVGVNYYFANKSWKVALILLGVMCLVFIGLFVVQKGSKFSPGKTNQKSSARDLLLIALPLTPVVQYILNNQDILSPIESLTVLAFFILFASLLIFAIPAFLGSLGSTRTGMILGLAFVYTITSMASLSNAFFWHKSGNLKIELLFAGGVYLVTWLFYNFKKEKVFHLLIILSFVANSVLQLQSLQGNGEEASLPVEDNKLLSLVTNENRPPDFTPNIYLLIYDAYVSSETMQAYGIDNAVQEEFLKGVGFELYPHTYSVAWATNVTMSRVLNASTEFYGDERKAVSGDGIIHNILRYFGYRTVGVFPFDNYFLSLGSSYDYSFPEISSASVHLVKAILLGEFRFDIGFKTYPRDEFLRSKHDIFTNISAGPNFIYMHSNYPNHSQNSGTCLPNETELFADRLNTANIEMQADVNTIISNDPGSIIIVAGDHGPYLTKNCKSTGDAYDISEISRLDIQDRYGTFLAVRWPTQGFEKYDEITVLQDIFPVIFAYLYNDERFLDSKIDTYTLKQKMVSGAYVQNGIIIGGIHDGEPLFLSGR